MTDKNKIDITALIEQWHSMMHSGTENLAVEMQRAGLEVDAEQMLAYAASLKELATFAETAAVLMTTVAMTRECPNCGYDLVRHFRSEAGASHCVNDGKGW